MNGRKYNFNGWINKQGIAHLNTNTLQQFHSYFGSTMLRHYNRSPYIPKDIESNNTQKKKNICYTTVTTVSTKFERCLTN